MYTMENIGRPNVINILMYRSVLNASPAIIAAAQHLRSASDVMGTDYMGWEYVECQYGAVTFRSSQNQSVVIIPLFQEGK